MARVQLLRAPPSQSLSKAVAEAFGLSESYVLGLSGSEQATLADRVVAMTSANVARDTGAFSDTGSVSSSGGPTVLFRSDWSTATGTSEAAIRDTGKPIPWSTYDIGSAAIQTIMSASGLGFPASMANVMRVSYEVADDYNWVVANQLWSLPSVGQARAFRLYFRHVIPDANGAQSGWAAEHPLETEPGNGGVSGNFSAWHFGSNGTTPAPEAGKYLYSFATAKAFPFNYLSFGNAGDGTSPNRTGFDKFVTYRHEWKYTRTGTQSAGVGLYTLDYRVYGGDDTTLVYTNATIFGWGGGALATGTNSQNYPMDDSRIRSIRIGDNGGIPGGTGAYCYYGGFAVADDWNGPYTGAN